MRYCILFFLLSFGIFTTAHSQNFTAETDFPGQGRFGAVRFVIGDKVYVGLGEAGAGNYPKDFYQYDAVSGQWTQIANFPGAGRESGIAYAVNGKGYVGLGAAFTSTSTTVFKDLWRYDPTVNQWTQLGDFDGGARSKAVAFVVGGEAYIGTGSDADFVFTNDFWKFNPAADSWAKQNSLSNLDPRFGSIVTVLDNKAYLCGGRGNNNTLFSQIHVFDPAANPKQWTLKKSDANNLRFVDGAGFVAQGKVYFCYGINVNFVTEYDPVANQVSNLGDLLGLGHPYRYALIAFNAGNQAFLGLGYTSVVANQASGYQKDLWSLPNATTPIREILPAESGIELFPTVGTGVFTLRLKDLQSEGKFTAQVLDNWGRPVAGPVLIQSNQQELNLGNLPSGLYFVQVYSGKWSWTHQVIRQ